ncbi:MAG: hypothetical protein WAU36_19490 [Cyclobacteriaceae bacterium]
MGVNKIVDTYRRYLLPGPFFSEKTIDHTTLLNVSWKENGEWVTPLNPTLIHFNKFFSSWNPTQLYRTRLERSIYEDFQLASESNRINDLSYKLKDLREYYWEDNDLQPDVDSITFIFLRRTQSNFQVTTDTLQTISF